MVGCASSRSFRGTRDSSPTVRCPNCHVILISLDTLRADALPCYGYTRNTAPNLCAFAQEHLLFTHAYSQADFTLPSHFSLFTGLYPSAHHVTTPFKDTLHPTIPTLAQVLHDHGYQTVYVGPLHDPNLPLERGLGRGFRYILSELSENNTLPNNIHVQRVTAQDPWFVGLKPQGWVHEHLQGWRDGCRLLLHNDAHGTPTFLFLHTYAVHGPYLVGREAPRRFTSAVYPNIPLTGAEYQAFSDESLAEIIQQIDARLTAGGTRESQARLQKLNLALRTAAAKKDDTTAFNHLHLTAEEAARLFGGYNVRELDSFYLERYFQRVNRSDPEQVAYLRALYDEQIAQLDHELGDLLHLLSNTGVLQRTILIITSDHGEEFMEHGRLEHGNNVFDTTIHVPLIMAVPGLEPRRIETLSQLIDLFPTVLHFVGIRSPATLNGVDLSPAFRDETTPLENRYVVAERRGGLVRAIRDHRWKLIVDREGSSVDYESIGEHGNGNSVQFLEPAFDNPILAGAFTTLYDLQEDSGEQHEVSGLYPDVVERLAEALGRLLAHQASVPAVEADFPAWIDPLKRKRLMKEGYF